jgi:glycosyltransferase involved in cell wall biosynthesis
MKRILHISPNFNYSCGVSKLVFLYLKYFGGKDDYEVHFITNGGDSLERLKEIQALKFRTLNFTRGIKNLLYRKKFLADVKKYILKNEINLIHSHHRFPEYISVKLEKEIEIKTVTSAHSFVKGFKKISFKSDKIIAVSSAVSSYLKNEFHIDEGRLITLYNPLEKFPEINLSEKVKIKAEEGIRDSYKVLLFMGRINKVKGYDSLLKAFEIISKKRKDVILLICGDVGDRKFERIVSNLLPQIKLLSSRRNNFLLYPISDLVVLPSRIDPFPFVMVEAGSFKKPFIGGNTGGIAEFIDDGVDGLLVDPEKPQELADKILYLLNNKDSAEQLGNNLYKKVKEKCDYNKYFSTVEEIYNSLLN